MLIGRFVLTDLNYVVKRSTCRDFEIIADVGVESVLPKFCQ